MATVKGLTVICLYFTIAVLNASLTFDQSVFRLPKPIGFAAYATTNDTIYIFGGLSGNYPSQPVMQSAIFKWDMNIAGNVTTLASKTPFSFMCNTQCTAITTTYPDKIFIFGVNDQFDFIGKSGTILTFDTSTQQFVSPLIDIIPKVPYPQIATCVAYDYDNNYIYLMGGQQNQNYMQIINMNDPSNAGWTMRLMPFFRESMQCAYFSDYIYIFGGMDYNISGVSDEIWKYKINTSEWEQVITNLVYPTIFANIIIPTDIDLFYIIGGLGSEGILNTVQVFNPWTEQIGVSYINGDRMGPMSSYNTLEKRIYVLGGFYLFKYFKDSIEYTSSVLNENDIFTTPPPNVNYPTQKPSYPRFTPIPTWNLPKIPKLPTTKPTRSQIKRYSDDDNHNDEYGLMMVISVALTLLGFFMCALGLGHLRKNSGHHPKKNEIDGKRKYNEVEMGKHENHDNKEGGDYAGDYAEGECRDYIDGECGDYAEGEGGIVH